MVCCQDEKIIFSQFIHESSQAFVKFLDLMAISFRISSVSPQGVKIYQIDKAESVEIFFTDFKRLLHTMNRTVGMVRLCDSFATENIIDLADTDHIKSCIF